MVPIKTPDEIARMKEAGRILSGIMDELAAGVAAGVRTAELDAAAAALMRQRGVRSAFKGYRGYPAHICVSVNEEVVHGIPGKRVLRAGDIVSLDIGIEKGGYYADMAKTFPVGAVDTVKRRLIEATRES